jgi:hypothetical protein
LLRPSSSAISSFSASLRKGKMQARG